MKKVIFILVAVIGFGIIANAQPQMQTTNYRDGNVLAYIEQHLSSSVSNCRGEKKADKLIVENVSNRTVTVKYSFRSVLYDCDDNFKKLDITNREVTLKPGEKKRESGYMSDGYVRYYYVEAFSVINVKVHEDAQNYNTTQYQQTQAQPQQQMPQQVQTIYVEKPQPKRLARKLAEPVQLLGYLWVYPEDLGNFKQQPIGIIENINTQNMYGRDNWRIPSPDELAVLENNAETIGLGEDTYMATDQNSGILRLVSSGEIGKAGNIKETSTGLRYQVIKEGTGIKPKAVDHVQIHYKGTLLDGTLLDSSYGSDPPTFELSQMISGMEEGLRLMSEGSVYKLWIPPTLAFGDEGVEDFIPPGTTLVYELELLKVITSFEIQKSKEEFVQQVLSSGLGERIRGTIWSTIDLGANSVNSEGECYYFNEALQNIPSGWRLPTEKEMNDLIQEKGKYLSTFLNVKDYSSSCPKTFWYMANDVNKYVGFIYFGYYNYEKSNNGVYLKDMDNEYPNNVDFSARVRYVLDVKDTGLSSTESQNSNSTNGVMVNGVEWSKFNVGSRGTFVSTPQSYGEEYTWTAAQNACPEGWRLPTKEEFKSLVFSGNTWNNNGYEFAGGKLFFPVTQDVSSSLPAVSRVDFYWSSTPNYENKDNYGRYYYHDLYLSKGYGVDEKVWQSMDVDSKCRVRCVKK